MQKIAHGITPAHAGKSPAVSVTLQHGEDHPRACGEKGCHVGLFYASQGSPPRMRGKGFAHLRTCCVVGITPAHAGKSHSFAYMITLAEDHPRACGEKISIASRLIAYPGSPPRMRGKVFGLAMIFTSRRITPAHAGKRDFSKLSNQDAGDHPRACGEKILLPKRSN